MEKDRWNLENTFIACKIRLGKQVGGQDRRMTMGRCHSKRVKPDIIRVCKRVTGRTGKPYSKYYIDGTHAYDLHYQESPPIRMLALNRSYLLIGVVGS